MKHAQVSLSVGMPDRIRPVVIRRAVPIAACRRPLSIPDERCTAKSPLSRAMVSPIRALTTPAVRCSGTQGPVAPV